jgi:hypothetical protein
VARRPDGITARSAHVTGRFRPSTVSTLDRMRGAESRSKFLERLILKEEKSRREGTGSTDG